MFQEATVFALDKIKSPLVQYAHLPKHKILRKHDSQSLWNAYPTSRLVFSVLLFTNHVFMYLFSVSPTRVYEFVFLSQFRLIQILV